MHRPILQRSLVLHRKPKIKQSFLATRIRAAERRNSQGIEMFRWVLAARESRAAAALAASWAFERRCLLEMGLNGAVAWLLLSSVPNPTELAVVELFRVVQKAGFLVVILGGVATYVDIALAGTRQRGIEAALRAALAVSRSGLLYALPLWLIGTFGDMVYAASVANPLAATVNLMAVLLLWPLVRQAVLKPLGRRRGEAAEEGVAGVAAQQSLPTGRDRDHAAAHEAGHIMVYAALEELPAGLCVELHDSAQPDGSLGFAGCWSSDHQLPLRSFVEWRMVVDLAGQVAEQQLLGEATLGAIQDHEVWLKRARGYLSLQIRGSFYARPQNAFEQARNDDALEALRREQLDLLKGFFSQNAALLSEIAGALAEQGRMGLDDLRPLLARVILPEGFPRASGSNFKAEPSVVRPTGSAL